MATYKIMQDVEAEDKILGPLTLRQFIYGLVTVFLLYICYLIIKNGATFLLVAFLPPAIFTGFFAFPFGRDQPTEVWALAKIRFLIKPRKRLWDQSGVKELVTINVPKRVEQFLTNGLSGDEVKSRLKALADTIDSRGWAVKNVNVNLFSQPGFMNNSSSDRLIDMSSLPKEVPNIDIEAGDDILDEKNNPIAHQFENMIHASTLSHRKKLVEELNTIRNEQAAKPADNNDYWFMSQSAAPQKLKDDQAMFTTAQVIKPGAVVDTSYDALNKADEELLAAQLKSQNDSQQVAYSHLRTLKPLENMSSQVVSVDHNHIDPKTPIMPSPTAYDPAIISLANNNDLNVATLAKEAYKAKNPKGPDDEVVISLH